MQGLVWGLNSVHLNEKCQTVLTVAEEDRVQKKKLSPLFKNERSFAND